MKHGFFLILPLLLMLSCQQPPEMMQWDDISFFPMEAKRLPDLNEPRSGHALVLGGDHVLVVGGHTTGFVPTATAEYYEDGRWHIIPTIYPHDTPFALMLKNGDVLIGGGYETNFGIGQSWGVECYHPSTHSFSPAYVMDRKRAHASALELESGEILISGNWYTTDVTEIYNHTIEATWIDTASENRSYPMLLPVTKDNVWIIGSGTNSYNQPTRNVVDQLKGAPFEVELLAKWHPQTPLDHNVQADAYRVTENSFLILACNAEGQYAPMLVDSSGFSLMPMEQPLPTEGPWGRISYMGSFWTVLETQTAWLMGVDVQKHVFLVEIDYQPAFQDGKAKYTMHYSQPLEEMPSVPWERLLPDGSFITAGGLDHTNFDSSGSAFGLYPKGRPKDYAALLFIVIGILIAIGLLLVIVKRKRKPDQKVVSSPTVENDTSSGRMEFGDKLKVLMEEKQLFKNKDLRIADVAAELGTNTTYLSTYLNGDLNTTFPTFITGYRIHYAQELMRENPSMRLAQVAETSGFANEKTFLRAFKASCGLTPSEWKQKNIP